jgi:fluoroacetyl-CoA thioesterase
MIIPQGLKHTSTLNVSNEHTAKSLGSGSLDVFATPAMIALMENAAMCAVEPVLPISHTTVGVEINVRHIKPTALNRPVYAEATLMDVDGLKLQFSLKAWDSEGDIGSGSHTRFIVESSKFLHKVSNS